MQRVSLERCGLQKVSLERSVGCRELYGGERGGPQRARESHVSPVPTQVPEVLSLEEEPFAPDLFLRQVRCPGVNEYSYPSGLATIRK